MIRRRRPAVLAVLLSLLAAGIVFGGLAKAKIETGVDSFLPASDPVRERYQRFAASFGGDAIVVLAESAEPRELLGADRLPEMLALEGEFAQLPDVARVYGPATTLNQIAGRAQLLLAELTGRRDGLRAKAERSARDRGAGADQVRRAGDAAVAGFDRRYGPMIVDGLPTGLPTLRNQRFVDGVLYNADGRPRPQWRYVVPDERAVAILLRPRDGLDQAATRRLVDAVHGTVEKHDLASARVTVTGSPRIVAALGEQAAQEIPLLGAAAGAAIGLCLVAVPWTAQRRRRLLPLGVTLLACGCTVAALGWLGQAISLGVVAFLPVLAGLGSYYATYFVRRARTRVVLVIAAATSVSFLTLALSPLPFVRDLGLTFALGVAFAVGLGWLAARMLPANTDADAGEAEAAETTPAAPRSHRLTAGFLAVAFAAAGWAALPSLPLQTTFEELTHGLPATDDAMHVEKIMGSSAELAVVLEGPDVLTPKAWRWMRAAQQQVIAEHGHDVRPILSPPGLLGFLGDQPSGDQIRAAHRLLPPYLSRAVVREDAQVALMSFGVRLDDLGHLRRMTDALRAELPPAPDGFRVELSGLPMVAVRGYELISGDRYLLGLAGVFGAGLVLLAGLGRRADALRAVAAALLATGAELLLIWLTGTPLNPLTVALGSLTAAVACEFTVMTAESARRRDGGLRRVVLLATATSAAGYAVLALSELAVMRQFGVLLAVSVGLSYLAARFVVWAWPATGTAGGETGPAGQPQEDRKFSLVGGA